MPIRLSACFALAALTWPGGATAQPHPRQTAGPYVVELQVRPGPRVAETAMRFSLTHQDGKPVDTARAGGFANFSSGGLKGRATLHPDGGNRLVGYGLISAKPDLRIAVSIALPGEPPVEAVFYGRPDTFK